MSRCTHWGLSEQADCHVISPEIVYQDRSGHQYCILHAPKFYVQPKGIFFGNADSFSVSSIMAKNKAFENALRDLIQAQSEEDTIRFDKIYWPDNYNNYLDGQTYPDKIFMFIDCIYFHGMSNSKIKSIRLINNRIVSPHIHHVETNEVLFSGSGIAGIIIRDSRIDSIVLSGIHSTHPVSIKKIVPLSEKGVWGTGISIKQSTFEKIVKIEELHFDGGDRNIIVEDSIFNQNIYYRDNKISGWINLSQNTLEGSKAYFENIDLARIRLSRHNLEYLRFSNCVFPDRYSELENRSLIQAEEVYRDLKKIAEEKKDYGLVSRWHFLEKEMSMLHSKKDGKSVVSVFLQLYRYLCGYGEKPSRAFYVLVGYFFAVFFSLILVALAHTGFHRNIDWDIVGTFPFSYADFIPLFVTPTKKSLADTLSDSSALLILYNLLAAIGRIFCIIQVGLFSMAIRNHLKR